MNNSTADNSTISPNTADKLVNSNIDSNDDEVTLKPVATNLSNQVVSANGIINSVSSLAALSSNSSTSTLQTSTTMLSIKVHIKDHNLTKTLQFNPTTLVFDALKIIREKVPETNTETGRKKNKCLIVFIVEQE